MKTKKFIFKKTGFIALCLTLWSGTINATTFTAVLSGNFTSATTWVGGLVPGVLLTTDLVVIPPGITVTLNTDVAFSSTSSLTVNGTLTSGANSTALTLTSGTLAGTGSISVDSLNLGLTSGFTFTGSLWANVLASTGASLSSAANVTVQNMLMLTSGAMSLTAGSLTVGNNSSINLSGGTLTASGTGVLNLDSAYNVTYSVSSAVSGPELSGTGLHNITLNLPGTITLSSNLGVNGTLALTSGTLSLNSHNLTFNSAGNLTAGTGNISGSSFSNIMVMSTGSLSGALSFASGGNTLHELTINMGSGGASAGISGALNVAGTLTLQTGTLSGTGSISTDSLNLGATANTTFSGSILAHYLTSTGASISSAANVTVSNALMLASGALSFTAGSLAMGNNSNINLTGGTLTASGSGALNLDSTYNVTYSITSATTGMELFGTGLHNITVNVPGTVTLSSNLGVNGTLALTGGTFALNGHNLTINTSGNLSTSAGNLSGTSSSNVTVMSTGSLTGALTFAAGSNTINNLTVNMGSSSDNINMGSSLNIAGILNLQSGNVTLGSNNISINAGGSSIGGSANSYVVTNSTGQLVMNLAAGITDTFKIGTAAHFAPMAIQANAGSVTSNIGINAAGGVYSAGTSGSLLSSTDAMVNNTWFVSSSDTVGINLNMYAMWSAAMEVNGFNRAQSFISHYTGGAWDLNTPSAATSISGGLYVMSRTGITSLSPFMVTDNTFSTTYVQPLAANNEVMLYPNPTGATLNFVTTKKIKNVEIYNVAGILVQTSAAGNNTISVDELPTGVYIAHLTGDGLNSVQRFVKE